MNLEYKSTKKCFIKKKKKCAIMNKKREIVPEGKTLKNEQWKK